MSDAHQTASLPHQSHSSVRAVLFDCDGVMCPPFRFADVLTKEHGITMEMTSQFWKKDFEPALIGKVDVAELLPGHLAEWGWSRSLEEFLALWLSSEREVRPEVAALVRGAKQSGYTTALATNQEHRRANYLRESMGFNELFDHCFISCELGHMKPSEGYYRVITERLGVTPSQIVFIDDSASYLAAAAAQGWQTVLFTDARDTEAKLRSILER